MIDPDRSLDPAWLEAHRPRRVRRQSRAEKGRAVAAYRDMTPVERTIALELTHATFGVGSPDKKFVASMAYEATTARLITEKQATYLLRTAHRYRRQSPEAHRLAGCCPGVVAR